MVGAEWQTNGSRRAKPMGSLSGWCDLTMPSTKGAKIAKLVAKKEASERVAAASSSRQSRSRSRAPMLPL